MDDLILQINSKIINPIVLLLFAFTFLYFIWGIYKYYIYGGGDEDRQSGSRHILAGFIGMIIMFGVFAFINIIVASLGIEKPSSLP